jgi:hypothetical protein
MAWAPAMVLNRMYHWAPRLMSRMPPTLRLIPVSTKAHTANGNSRLAGKLARIRTMGWARRAARGFNPMRTPIGTHTTVATATRTTTRPKVIRPCHSGVQNTPHPWSSVT